jgi:glycosyltransferase involved in cell wall biosynthesis
MRSPDSRSNVTIVFRYVPQYRARFYDLLKEILEGEGVNLRLVHGDPERTHDVTKQDAVNVPWATHIRNRVIRVAGRDVFWQPCLGLLREADLIIVEQANKLLLNYVLALRHLTGRTRVAYWGHGEDPQRAGAHTLGSRVKGMMSRHVDWWFAYTESTAARLRALGFPQERISVVNNSLDTAELRRYRSAYTEADERATRESLGITGDTVGVFLGAAYPARRISWLLEAGHEIRARIPDFELLFIGAGTELGNLRAAAADLPWIHVAGPLYGEEKACAFLTARVTLMPFVVGLSVLDAFALEVPLVTTDAPGHGPEADYLVNDLNCVVADEAGGPAGYAVATAALLQDADRLCVLRRGCSAAASRYTIEDMAARFAGGILAALEAH